MPVVINEVEIVVEPESPPLAGEGPRQAPPPMTPLEIAELLERRARTELRLFAH